ncbi:MULTISPECIES: dTDP-4-dehydrorhamnose 3,5-epimerase family protein [unclassified Mycobacterium]|uniref:dTDP-4-dehydrorhamnose 3,5-epimerase family protein n=1 Tax=unclassified Mycobacterium TaxID=2642494 RepID=UPI0006DC4EBF|nr:MULTISPECIES: dTDP-4-dehydrorhamnose 3,5-epimerase family protein [unclassified Mycobacterium]OBF04217.1 dTDP-4-dehydrorhamnose 3,5-epimerase [Mycobacterium sp. ACS4054]OBG59119.1 dTDP-4-dehydrorhamnose 3,5-epimerase [Mycobacterium sp. E3339]OBH83687.1 dTDP-4-dehydrorhamnose 3,5-epimerase [Mycobacterium sp. E2989]
MKYTPTQVAGVTIIDLEPQRDHRGFSSRSYCADEFASRGLTFDVTHTHIYFNYTRGTVRGLHHQGPHAQTQLIRCTRGAIAAVAVDIRPGSKSYGDHTMVELSAENYRALFLPPFVAHGFQTLVDDTEVSYQVSGPPAPFDEQGFHWSEPEFGIVWPLPVTVISERDASWPSRTTNYPSIESAASCLSR